MHQLRSLSPFFFGMQKFTRKHQGEANTCMQVYKKNEENES